MKSKNIDLLWLALAGVILLFCAFGCRTAVPIARTDTIRNTVYVEKVRDSVVYLTDSAGFMALLECDSLGNARVKQIQDFYAGQFVKPKIVVKDNFVKVDCKIDSGQVYLHWKETHREQTQSITTVKVERVNYIKPFQWAQIWAGRLLIFLVLIYTGFRLLKRYTSWKI